MSCKALSRFGTAALLGCALLSQPALANTEFVFYDHLGSATTVATPLLADDTLFVDTFTTERGSLLQTTTFTVGPNVRAFTGSAAWLVGEEAGAGPRLVGVNIDLFDSSNNLVQSDTFAGLLAGFAHSTFSGSLLPGTYSLVATGTGARDSSLDISLTMAVPEPETYAMLFAGLGLVGFAVRRRKQGQPS